MKAEATSLTRLFQLGLRKEDPPIERLAAQEAFDMIKAGMSEDTFYSLFVRCFLCRQVILESQFLRDHQCSEKVLPEPEPQSESPRLIHLLSLADVGDGSAAEIPTDIDTDAELEA
jgi:hypothetical protein